MESTGDRWKCFHLMTPSWSFLPCQNEWLAITIFVCYHELNNTALFSISSLKIQDERLVQTGLILMMTLWAWTAKEKIKFANLKLFWTTFIKQIEKIGIEMSLVYNDGLYPATGKMWKFGVGVTKAPFVNFSVSRIFDLAKVHVRLFQPHSYLTDVTAAELRRHLPNMNMIFNSWHVFWRFWKIRKITERRKLA